MNKNSKTILLKSFALVNFAGLLGLFLYFNSTKTEKRSIPKVPQVEQIASDENTKSDSIDTLFYSHQPSKRQRLSSSKSIIIIQNPTIKNGQEQLIEMLLNRKTKE